MSHPDPAADLDTVPLQSAFLCVDCESVSACQHDCCPVCGGHSLLGLARLLGGTLESHKASARTHETVLFDVSMSIELHRMNAPEFSAVVASITGALAPIMSAGERASFHVDVEPHVETRAFVASKAA